MNTCEGDFSRKQFCLKYTLKISNVREREREREGGGRLPISCIHEEITCRLNSRNACYHSVQNFSSYCMLSENIKIKIRSCNFAPLFFVRSFMFFLNPKSEYRHFQVRGFSNIAHIL